MITLQSRQAVVDFIDAHKSSGMSLGFIPTMGALHEGHLSLIKCSLAQQEITLVSIFVNPAQFGPNEDFDRYPRQHTSDLAQLSSLGVTAVFLPSVSDMYPLGMTASATVRVPRLSQLYCGHARPQFFDGVCDILLRLLILIQPDSVYMGEKDFQQWFIVKQMVRDLGFSTEIVCCPLVRDEEGVALSSRLQYVPLEAYSVAKSIFPALLQADVFVKKGESSPSVLRDCIACKLSDDIEIDYIVFISATTLQEVDCVHVLDRVLFSGVLSSCGVRLIDTLSF